jgi:predicted  nucleic acid-binding Zn-ribbon protein
MTTPELTQWLRDNSSGVYRPAAEAADVIEQLQRERDKAREELATMEIRHAAVMLHTQNIVDEANQFREQRDRQEEALRRVIKWMNESGYYDVSPYHQANEALQSLTLK